MKGSAAHNLNVCFKAYILLLENDSNPEVRRAVLSCIAPSALTLPKIYKRTRDVKEKVRKLAYQVDIETFLHREMDKTVKRRNNQV